MSRKPTLWTFFFLLFAIAVVCLVTSDSLSWLGWVTGQ